MAYAVPPQRAHGDVPTGAIMQKYSDALTAIKEQTDQSRQNAAGVYGFSESVTTFIHVHRYLAYDGTGEIVDLADATNSVGLSDPDSGWGHYDLNTVAWLYPGKMYVVTGVTGCFEIWWND